jgi:hypothetical protein
VPMKGNGGDGGTAYRGNGGNARLAQAVGTPVPLKARDIRRRGRVVH